MADNCPVFKYELLDQGTEAVTNTPNIILREKENPDKLHLDIDVATPFRYRGLLKGMSRGYDIKVRSSELGCAAVPPQAPEPLPYTPPPPPAPEPEPEPVAPVAKVGTFDGYRCKSRNYVGAHFPN